MREEGVRLTRNDEGCRFWKSAVLVEPENLEIPALPRETDGLQGSDAWIRGWERVKPFINLENERNEFTSFAGRGNWLRQGWRTAMKKGQLRPLRSISFRESFLIA